MNWQLEKPGKDDADAAHLAGDVSERDDDQAKHGDHARSARIVSLADEIRHRKLAELAQIRRKQERKQNITAGPAHQVHRCVIAAEGDNPRHRDKRRGAHPVGGGRHAVRDWIDVTAGDVELRSRRCARPDRYADIKRKGKADKKERKLLHRRQRDEIMNRPLEDVHAIHWGPLPALTRFPHR